MNEKDLKELNKLLTQISNIKTTQQKLGFSESMVDRFDIQILEIYKVIFLLRRSYSKELTGQEKQDINYIFNKYRKHEKKAIDEFRNYRTKIMYIISMVDFLERKKWNKDQNDYPDFSPEKGQIFYANLLLGFKNELSFSHPVLILEVDDENKLVFCIPMTSVKYIENNEKKLIPYIQKEKGEIFCSKEFTGLKKDSVLLFNQPMTLSFYRMTSDKKEGHMLDPLSNNFNQRMEKFNEIVDNVNGFTLPYLISENEKLRSEIKKLTEENEFLNSKENIVKRRLIEIEKKIKNLFDIV